MTFIPAYILILTFTIGVDFYAGIKMEDAEPAHKKLYLILSLITTCAVLFIFKYFNFFNHNFEVLEHFLHWNYSLSLLKIILPIGLSFHTFQSLSYVIEVYRGQQIAERHLGIYALYVMFYPQLVAGPIERPQNLLPQFRQQHDFDYQRVTDGLKRMAWGLFKKVVIADRLALLVNHVYASPHGNSGLTLILATCFFAWQIYCDFSGYSDIALGSAQVMGFTLMENFRRPYFSKNIAEFWKRWHISLSTWFRDYLYIPLGGNRVSKWRWQINLMVTFLISGLWHGANWTFIIWGGINGFYLVFAFWTKGLREKISIQLGLRHYPFLQSLANMGITFALICFAWIFFRANNLNQALYISTHLMEGMSQILISQYWRLTFAQLGMSRPEFMIAIVSLVILCTVQILQKKRYIFQLLAAQHFVLRWILYFSLVFSIIYLMEIDTHDFIYFRF